MDTSLLLRTVYFLLRERQSFDIFCKFNSLNEDTSMTHSVSISGVLLENIRPKHLVVSS